MAEPLKSSAALQPGEQVATTNSFVLKAELGKGSAVDND